MRLPVGALQKAVYLRLTDGSDGITGTLAAAKVVDYAPPELSEPYLLLGQFTLTALPLKGAGGIHEPTYTIFVLSDSGSWKEVNDIMDATIVSLTATALTLDDQWAEVRSDVDFGQTIPLGSSDGKLIRQGVLRFRWRIQDTAT